MEFSITFVKIFIWGVYLTYPLLIMLCGAVVLLAIVVGRLESWRVFESIYWGFITAFTVGYGDFRPLRKDSRVLAVMIAAVGIMVTGLLVAITVETASSAFEMHVDPKVLEQIEQQLR